jgi:PIN domain nuclease of toxin-antitoxin system
VRYLLDTVTFIWALQDPEKLFVRARSVLSDGSAIREISSVSVSEIGIKYSNGKLDLTKRVVVEGIIDLELRVLPYSADYAYVMFDLPLHHKDPFDRQLIAQALFEKVPVITPDERFEAYQKVQRIW